MLINNRKVLDSFARKCSNCKHWLRTTKRGGSCNNAPQMTILNTKENKLVEVKYHTQSYHLCKLWSAKG